MTADDTFGLAPWELAARERIRDSLARYNWSGDAFRLDGLAAAFCPDGVLEIRGRVPVVGRAAIAELLGGAATDDQARRQARQEAARSAGAAGAADAASAAGGRPAPTIVRHNLTNVRFVAVEPDQAQVESYFTVLTDIGLDHYGRYRDRFVPQDGGWLIAHRFVSTDWRAPDSLMARDQVFEDGAPA